MPENGLQEIEPTLGILKKEEKERRKKLQKLDIRS
jgi:hypothetical protein